MLGLFINLNTVVGELGATLLGLGATVAGTLGTLLGSLGGLGLGSLL